MAFYLLFLGTLWGVSTIAQDEAEFQRWRQKGISSGPPSPPSTSAFPLIPSWKVQSPRYRVDISGDGEEEELRVLKVDGLDYLELFKGPKRIYRFKFPVMGPQAWTYQARLIDIDSHFRALLLFYDQGELKKNAFYTQAQLFVLTFRRDLSQWKMTTGPVVFWEERPAHLSPQVRSYQARVQDINGDGLQDVVLPHHLLLAAPGPEGMGFAQF